MPLIKIQTNVNIDSDLEDKLLSDLSNCVAEGIGKPVRSVMACIDKAAITISDTPGHTAFAEVKSIGGLDREVNGKMSASLCNLLQESLNIPPARVYINFVDIEPVNWGWDGSTFG